MTPAERQSRRRKKLVKENSAIVTGDEDPRREPRVTPRQEVMQMGRSNEIKILEVRVSDDGKTMLLTIEQSDGTGGVMEVPYENAEWLAKSIFAVSSAALERQEQTGELQTSRLAGEALLTESIRALYKPRENKILIEATDSWLSNDAPGMISLLLEDSALASVLRDELREIVQNAPTFSRPS